VSELLQQAKNIDPPPFALPVISKWSNSMLFISTAEILPFCRFMIVTLPCPYRCELDLGLIDPLQLNVPGANSTMLPAVKYLFIVIWSEVPVQTAVACDFHWLVELEAAIIIVAALTRTGASPSMEKRRINITIKVAKMFLLIDLLIVVSPIN